jgi:hypothetical protein
LHNYARGIAENCMATGRTLVPVVVGNVWNNREWYLSITSRQKSPWVIPGVFVAFVTVLLFLGSSIPLGNALEEWLL